MQGLLFFFWQDLPPTLCAASIFFLYLHPKMSFWNILHFKWRERLWYQCRIIIITNLRHSFPIIMVTFRNLANKGVLRIYSDMQWNYSIPSMWGDSSEIKGTCKKWQPLRITGVGPCFRRFFPFSWAGGKKTLRKDQRICYKLHRNCHFFCDFFSLPPPKKSHSFFDDANVQASFNQLECFPLWISCRITTRCAYIFHHTFLHWGMCQSH